jgi:hypothetical protein
MPPESPNLRFIFEKDHTPTTVCGQARIALDMASPGCWYRTCSKYGVRPLTTQWMVGKKISEPEFSSSSNLLIPSTLFVVKKRIDSSYIALATRAGLYKKR